MAVVNRSGPWPKVQMFTSKDLRADSVKNAVDPHAVGIELHDLAQWVGHVRPRSFDDTVPLLQLAQAGAGVCSRTHELTLKLVGFYRSRPIGYRVKQAYTTVKA